MKIRTNFVDLSEMSIEQLKAELNKCEIELQNAKCRYEFVQYEEIKERINTINQQLLSVVV
jgi:ribosomal protein L29